MKNNGWMQVKLEDVCEIILSQSPPSSTYRKRPDGLPFFQGKADFGDVSPTPTTWCVKPHKIAEVGDILISVRAPVGPTNIANTRCCIGRGLAALRCRDSINRDFLLAGLKLYESAISRMGSGSTFKAITGKQLKALIIPLPPLSEQKRIAAILNDHMADIVRARAAAEAQLEAAEALSTAYLREIFESKEAQKWSCPQLKEIAGINPRRPRDLRRADETPTTFVPMPSVDGTSGTISNPLEKPFGKVRKGYTYFEKNDVLFAKITPCMQNGKHVIARNLIDGIGFGTTEFHVIRPGDEVIPEWIHLYIRQPSILNAAATHFTGSVGQQRVPSYFLETLAIPLPSLSEQKRIAAILNDRMAGIARACNAVREKLEAINHLPSAILRKAFNGEL